jgi:UDP-N-acetylmuramoyl-L-alanyl-D-glutamate--2,6-diaminopimelate ligase
MVGEVFAENALAAALAGLAAGLPGDAVARGIAACPSSPAASRSSPTAPASPPSPSTTPTFPRRPRAHLRHRSPPRRRGQVIVVFGAGGGNTADKLRRDGRGRRRPPTWRSSPATTPATTTPRTIAAALLGRRARGPTCAARRSMLDRGHAIARALDTRRAGDVVVIAGKGHEQGQVVHGRSAPFSDVEAVRRGLALTDT